MTWKFLVLLFLVSIIIESGKCKNTTTERSNETTETASSNEDTTTETVTTTQTSKYDDAIAKYTQTNIKLSSEFLLVLADLIPLKAVQLSSVLVSSCLALLYVKASGKTAEDFSSYSNNQNPEDLRRGLLELKKRSKSWPVDFRTVIAIDNKYKFSNSTIKIAKELLINGKLLTVEFGNIKSSINIINTQLNENLQDNLTDVVTSVDLKKRKQELAIFLSIFIKLQLVYDYGTPKTERRYFNKAQNQKIKIDYTVITTSVKYYKSKSLAAQIIRIPAKDGLEVTLINPVGRYEAKNVLKKIVNNSNLFLTERAKCENRNVTIALPSKTNYETISDILQILKKLELVPTIFDAKKAQYDNLLSDNKPIAVTSIFQRAVITSSITIKQKYASKLEKKKPVLAEFVYPHIYVITAGDYILTIGYYGGP